VTDTEPAEITVVIADDHQVVRSGLRLVLHGHEGMRVVGEAGDVAEALRLVAARHPDVLVLDLNMPGEPSLPAIPRVAEACDRTRVVVLTMQDDPAFAREALQGGASGFVLKESAGAELVAAVRAAAQGRTYLNPELGARLVAAPAERPADDLSGRERDVLRLIALGHTNPEIAEKLYLSVRTIETHRSHIHRKLGVGTRAELVRYALENGLVTL
jgi:two-component system response regulator NreC